MAQYQVDSEAVQAASHKVRQSIDSMRSELQGMQSHLTQLQSSWTGQASQSFQTVIAQWHSTQRTVESNLESINLGLNTAGQQYAATEETNAQMFSGA